MIRMGGGRRLANIPATSTMYAILVMETQTGRGTQFPMQ